MADCGTCKNNHKCNPLKNSANCKEFELIVTNADRIRAELQDDRKLAELLISCEHEPDYELNYDDDLEYWGETDYFITPNGVRFSDFEEAVTETLDWLKQEAGGTP